MEPSIKHTKTAQQPTSGYAPVSGLEMYYEIHGTGDPVVLLHGSFMTITNNWTRTIAQLSRSRQVIAVEMQGHGRTADIDRAFSYENLADDIAALLDYLKITQAESYTGQIRNVHKARHTDSYHAI
jgi:pimeloyl-ACP methyl ester carboxylesterase